MEPLRLSRRGFLQALGAAGLGMLAPRRGWGQEARAGRVVAKSLIVLWLDGGPSQLETFDPHPGKAISGGTKARATRAKGVQIAEGFEQLADVMDSVSLIRSLSSKEGDHERGQYNLKTGYRMEPTVEHPTLGAILCHEQSDPSVEVPRHVTLLPERRTAWGGYLGAEYDGFRVGDPAGPVPDVLGRVSKERYERRMSDLEVLEGEFARGRGERAERTGHREMVGRARRMMLSEQLEAFDVSKEPEAVRAAYGDTPFGRACLAARRLVEVGVGCVEVGLGGWDTHINNHELVARRVGVLDPAFASLIRELKERDRLSETLILCLGEFGRTPKINPAGGRDHWPQGFSVALAGGPIAGGRVIGETDPEGGREVKDPKSAEDLAATVLAACGVEAGKELMTPVGRPIALSQGRPIRELFAD